MRGEPVNDVAIVGAGAAGLAAAIESASLGMRTALMERSRPGGAVARLARIETEPGHPVGLTGAEFTARAVAQAERFGVRVDADDEVTGLSREGDRFTIERRSGNALAARAVIVATGADRPLPAICGLPDLLGVGVYTAMPADLPATLRGRDAVVAGGSAAAGDAVLRLSAWCRSVTLVTARTSRVAGLGAAVRGRENVAILSGTEIVCVDGVDHLESIVVRRIRTGEITACSAAALFVTTDAFPRTQWLPAAVARDESGFVMTGGAGAYPSEASLPGLFAAGDVRSGSFGVPGLAGAIAAARDVENYLEWKGERS